MATRAPEDFGAVHIPLGTRSLDLSECAHKLREFFTSWGLRSGDCPTLPVFVGTPEALHIFARGPAAETTFAYTLLAETHGHQATLAVVARMSIWKARGPAYMGGSMRTELEAFLATHLGTIASPRVRPRHAVASLFT